jgi:hypothetical protein
MYTTTYESNIHEKFLEDVATEYFEKKHGYLDYPSELTIFIRHIKYDKEGDVVMGNVKKFDLFAEQTVYYSAREKYISNESIDS